MLFSIKLSIHRAFSIRDISWHISLSRKLVFPIYGFQFAQSLLQVLIGPIIAVLLDIFMILLIVCVCIFLMICSHEQLSLWQEGALRQLGGLLKQCSGGNQCCTNFNQADQIRPAYRLCYLCSYSWENQTLMLQCKLRWLEVANQIGPSYLNLDSNIVIQLTCRNKTD